MNHPLQKEETAEPTIAIEVLSRIETEEITPTPRWYFILRNTFFVSACIFSLIVGMGAVSVMLFAGMHSGFRFYIATHKTLGTFIIEALPLLWIATLVLVITVGYHQFRHTAKGYRYSLGAVVVGAVFISGLGGLALHVFGIGGVIDELIGERIPLHKSVVMQQKEWWVRPSEGLLAGEIVSKSETGTTTLIDFNGGEWIIITDDIAPIGHQILSQTAMVRIVGFDISTATTTIFHACFLFPWDLPRPKGDRPKVAVARSLRSNREQEHVSERCRGINRFDHLRAIHESMRVRE